MIWSYFPVGMSFPVEDFSEESKRRCWETALSAAAAGTPEGLTLYDSCSEAVAGGAQKEYICILNHKTVVQSRANMAVWSKRDRLLCRLSLHKPFYQANALDGFGPYVLLGEIGSGGNIERSESGRPFLPERLPTPMPVENGRTVLIAVQEKNGPLGCTAASVQAGRAAAENGWHVQYCPFAEGGCEATFALTHAKGGRFEWVQTQNDREEDVSLLLGVIPGFTAVFDCAGLLTDGTDPKARAHALGLVVKRILDLGYRRLVLHTDGVSDTDASAFSQLLTDRDDPMRPEGRLRDCELTLLTGNRMTADRPETMEGVLGLLVKRGASVRFAPTYLFERMRLEERCTNADLVIAGASQRDGMLSEIEEVCQGNTPIWTIPHTILSDPEKVFNWTHEKFRSR